MPTKNRIELLRNAIKSVINQTYVNWELIVVDDGSNDGTKNYLEELAQVDSRVRYLSNSVSHGGPASRNAAINLAHGDYITGLDDDDSFTPDRLQVFADAWVAYAEQGIKLSALYSEQNIYQYGFLISKTQKPESTSYDDLFSRNYIGNQIFAPTSSYVSAGLFRPDLPAWQDLEFFMRIVKQFGTAYLVPYATYNFDESPRPDRISFKNEEKLRAAFEIVNKLHSDTDSRKTQRLLLQLLGKYYRVPPRIADYQRFVYPNTWLVGIIKLIFKNIQTTKIYAQASIVKNNIRLLS